MLAGHPNCPLVRTRRTGERLAVAIITGDQRIGGGNLVLDPDSDSGPEWCGEIDLDLDGARWWANLPRGTGTLSLSHPRRPYREPAT